MVAAAGPGAGRAARGWVGEGVKVGESLDNTGRGRHGMAWPAGAVTPRLNFEFRAEMLIARIRFRIRETPPFWGVGKESSR